MNRLIAPTTDFRAVRDGRNSQIFYIDVALDSARSVAAGTALVLNVAGNSFYCDANPTDGNCQVHFQDTNFDKGPLPLYVSPGAIFNIPFTQILIENSAQAGKKVRLAYGIDVDFQPGSVSQIAVTNAGGYTSIRPEASTGFFIGTAALVANTPDTIFAPAANVNGAILLSADFSIFGGAGIPAAAFVAHTAAPANITTGEHIVGVGMTTNTTGGNVVTTNTLKYPAFIAAGKGLYFISDSASGGGAVPGNSYRSCRYKLL